MKRIMPSVKYAIVIAFLPFIAGCPIYWYVPANSLAPRPIYVYSQNKLIPTVSASFRDAPGYNRGERAQLGTASFRVGGRFLLFQGFIGASGYTGFYQIGAIDSVYKNKTAYGFSPEGEFNLVIPIKNVSFGVGSYVRESIERGSYHHFIEHEAVYPDIDEDGEDEISAKKNDNFVDIHWIFNLHSKFDYTFIWGGFISPGDFDSDKWNYNETVIGMGVSSSSWGGWLTITPSKNPTKDPYMIDVGVSYRLYNGINIPGLHRRVKP